jgi:uncharacterized protein (TIGR02266 family)
MPANDTSRPANSSTATTAPGERRELRFRFECATLDAFGALYAPDISRGGIFIRTRDVLPLASPVKLELLLADESPFIVAEGLVFWTRDSGQAGAQGEPGMGIRFTKMSQDSHRNLTHVLTVKKAEERIREAEAEGEAEEDSWTEEVNTLVASSADLRAAVVRGSGGVPEAAAVESAAATRRHALPARSDETAAATVDVVEQALAERAFAEEVRTSKAARIEVIAAPDSSLVIAPVAVSPSGRSLSRPLPLLPDWAFVSTRFGAQTPAAGTAKDAASDDDAAADAAVPQHIPDVRDTSFGAPGSVATLAIPARPSAAPRGWALLRRYTGLRLIAGAALVLVTTLALAPRQKQTMPAARPRAAVVSTPAAHAARLDRPTTAPEFAPSSERVVSQAAEQPAAARTR